MYRQTDANLVHLSLDILPLGGSKYRANIFLDQISNECNRLIAVYLLIWIKRCSRGLSVVAPSIDFCQRNNVNRDDLTNVTTARCDCRKTIRR
jgi:hypothetical protein